MRKMGRKSGPEKAKDGGYLKTCGQGLGKVSVGNGFRSSVSLMICLEGWRRGDTKRLKKAAAGCSWAGRRKLGET